MQIASFFFFFALFCCHVRPVQLYHIFLHYLINGTIFGVGGGWEYIERKIRISRSDKNSAMYISCRIKYPLFLTDINET